MNKSIIFKKSSSHQEKRPEAGDIIFCKLPNYQNPNEPGKNYVPVLLIGWQKQDNGDLHAIIAPTEKNKNNNIYPTDLLIEKPESIQKAGFKDPRKICFGKQKNIPWDNKWFLIKKEKHKLGTLDEENIEKAKICQTKARIRDKNIGQSALFDFKPPEPGSIILIKVPHHNDPQISRIFPCLVMSTEQNINGKARINYVPASAATGENHPFNLQITDEQELKDAGLTRDTYFKLRFQNEIEWTPENWIIPKGKTSPEIGKLNEESWSRAIKAYGRCINSIGVNNLSENTKFMPKPPKQGDIIYAYAPYNENPNQPGPKPRPCLVLEAKIKKDPKTGDITTSILMVPGTSQKTWTVRNGEMCVSESTEMEKSGLTKETKFKCDQKTIISWDQSYICFRDGGPILGEIPNEKLKIALIETGRIKNTQTQQPEQIMV